MTTFGNTIMVLSFIAAVVIWVSYNWYLLGKAKHEK